MTILIAVVAAYFVGSLPFGYLIGRWIRGIDVRSQGSGNIGATNVGRVLGKKWGVAVLCLDALKGFLPTLLSPQLAAGTHAEGQVHLHVACGLAAVLGHMFPVWLKFKGGKGVATALGAVVLISWISTVAAAAIFLAVFAAFRIVSLASVLSVLGYAVSETILLWPAVFSESNWSRGVFALAGPLLIVIRHRSNLARLLRGEEMPFRAGGGSGGAASAEPEERRESLEEGQPSR